MSCESCNGLFFLHIEYDGTGLPEIESCDQCRPIDEMGDIHAAIIHRLFCGCGVPEISAGRVDQETGGATMFPFPTFGKEYEETMRLMKKHGILINVQGVEEERAHVRQHYREAA